MADGAPGASLKLTDDLVIRKALHPSRADLRIVTKVGAP